MFGISLSEFVVIICMAMLFIKPEDLPALTKKAKTIFKKFHQLKNEYSKTIYDFDKDLDIGPRIVIDNTGKPQIAYDIDDLKEDLSSSKQEVTHYKHCREEQ